MKLRIKDYLKINVFPALIRVTHQLGVSYEKLGKISFFMRSNLLAQAKELGKFEVQANEKPQNIFVLLMLPGSTFHLYVETLLALGLKKKGHHITFIIDDNTLPIHELKKRGNEANWDYEAERDFIFASKFLNNIGLDFISISDFIKDVEEIQYKNQYDTILEATLLKQYKVGIVTEDLPLLPEKKELIKQAIAISEAVGKKLVRIQPDFVIMSHGIYSTWGPVFQILDHAGIPILVHGRGKKRHSQVFNWNKTGDSWDVSVEWEKVKNKDLTEKQLEEINAYLESRISHKDDVFVYNFGEQTGKEKTLAYLGLTDDKPIYSLYTNVLWDAASAQREIAFRNPVEWVIETIKWFNEHPEKQLIVKIHPAEIVIGTKMPFYDIIINHIRPADNVKIIRPEEKVNSWSIYEISALGMVHTTTAGMEIPLVNRACAVVSKTHYRGKGFTIDINSKEEYFELLNHFDPASVDYERNRKQALKYAYLLFIRYQIPFNYFYEEITTSITGFRYSQIDEYMKDKLFNKIIENIENKENIFLKNA